MTVVITGNRISALGETGKVRVPQDAQVVDATGKFVIPGLWDMHVHWELKDSLPLFIASVDTATSILSLYTTHRVSCLPYTDPIQQVTMHLDWHEWNCDNGDLHQYLGDPIIRCGLGGKEPISSNSAVYDVLKIWVCLEHGHRALRQIGVMMNMMWETNTAPRDAGS